MLCGSEGADRHAELRAGLEIFDRGFQRSSMMPTASAHIAVNDHAPISAMRFRDAIAARPDLDAGEGDVGGVQAVLGRITLFRDAPALPGTRNTPMPLISALAALGARSRSACLRARH